jgi:hypothetical protein
MLDRLKWAATLTLIIGSFVNAAGWYWGPHVLIFGGLLWLIASAWMRDKPLIVTNSLMTLGGIAGLIIR